ncbi:hypothetical protein EWM64_g10445 [Hericium alpestre]|uniref:Uncharacterized protein n=1 Tax=Hericium alpestre TaxID=135208 RepID=A0A4Y9ZHT4_9AGAM|nr:hypothetical protein EWM64_g10445 [Hericium alpestre]
MDAATVELIGEERSSQLCDLADSTVFSNMDTDPLRETSAPRYAIESDDEEDEFNPLPSRAASSALKNLNVQIKGPSESSQLGGSLLVASGDAGKIWARGADLGEQQGAVYVNEHQVGLVFKPSWLNTTVLVSEVATGLPVWAMHSYAQTVIDFFKPSNIVLLDTYPYPTYITDSQVPFHEAPVRYLRTSGKTSPSSFMSLIYVSMNTSAPLSSPPVQATLLLLPSPRIASLRPSELTKPNMSSMYDEDASWASDLMQELHHTALSLIGEKPTSEWKLSKVKSQGHLSNNRSGDVGEGSMYI